MENDKMYYVPEITQLFVGYICEIYKPHHPKLGAQGYWKQVKIGDIGQGTDIIPLTKFRNLKKENRIRTKYLDGEDIKELNLQETYSIPDYSSSILIHSLDIYFGNDNYIEISCYSDEGEPMVLFRGECKSINELNKILKLLKIK